MLALLHYIIAYSLFYCMQMYVLFLQLLSLYHS